MVESSLGRFLEGRSLEQQQLLRVLVDLGSGLGPDVEVSVDGRELVFRREGRGRGFLRVIPRATSVLLGFPRGSELFDPRRRLEGPAGLQRSCPVREPSDLDGYVRRLIDEAHRLEG